jgi:hypothetical protein
VCFFICPTCRCVPDAQWCIICSVEKYATSVFNNAADPLRVDDIKTHLPTIFEQRQFQHDRQHDVAEFFTKFVEWMLRTAAKRNLPAFDLFEGQFREMLQCKSCKALSPYAPTPFHCLSIEISGSTQLVQCLNNFFATEVSYKTRVFWLLASFVFTHFCMMCPCRMLSLIAVTANEKHSARRSGLQWLSLPKFSVFNSSALVSEAVVPLNSSIT